MDPKIDDFWYILGPIFCNFLCLFFVSWPDRLITVLPRRRRQQQQQQKRKTRQGNTREDLRPDKARPDRQNRTR